MTELFVDRLSLPTAPLGPDNPLPPLFGTGNRDFEVDMSEASDEIRTNAAYGRVPSIAPYLLQDDYARDRVIQEHPVAVLENGLLRATFLLGAGGRLWSLVHKPSGRELLFRNGILQPANLGLRNAWFAGGVEWNVGTIGHAPGTFSPIHAARVEHPDGTPVLRLYEFDRIRNVVYQVDAHLPAGSGALFIHVRLTNPNDHDVPTYWWSNIAVEQTEHTRVISCAEQAWNYGYANSLRRVPVVDEALGIDVTYPGRVDDAADYFFDTDAEANPWITAVDAGGTGLAQISSPQLRGRKLFLWGTSVGGERWQEWLSGPERAYIEIQAGLARTQFEHVRLPAGGEISWVEAYGRVDVPAEAAHGEWSAARAAARTAVHALASPSELEAERTAAAIVARAPISEVLHRGSGWGALEDQRRLVRGRDRLSRPEAPFEAVTLTAEQRDWIELIEAGRFPHDDPAAFPRSLQVHPEWEAELRGRGGWVEAALRGNALAHREDFEGARAEWLQSIAITPNVLSVRNLAALSRHLGDLDQACEWYDDALQLSPHSVPLAIEAIRTYLLAGQGVRACRAIESLPAEARVGGRVRLLEATARIAVGDLEGCRRIIDGGIEVADLREGESSLHALWWDLRTAEHARSAGISVSPELRARVARAEPVPAVLDFRMRRDELATDELEVLGSAGAGG
ncbi:DUF5107 domain-containing protein [Microbacterium sp. P5_E9]